MRGQLIWLVILVAVCGLYMARQTPVQPMAAYNPRGGPLSVDDLQTGVTRATVQKILGPPGEYPSEKETFGWVSYNSGRRVAFNPGPSVDRVWAVQGHVLQQTAQPIVRVGDSSQQVALALGPPLSKPHWAEEGTSWYLEESVEIEFANDRVKMIRLYSQPALNFLHAGP